MSAEKPQSDLEQSRQIVTHQRVALAKALRARKFRREPTPSERLLWRRLRGRRLGGFKWRRQQVVDGFSVDFYCDASGLVIELDGPVHDEQMEVDELRDRNLQARGLRVLRFRNKEVERHTSAVLQRILAACRASGDRGAPTDP